MWVRQARSSRLTAYRQDIAEDAENLVQNSIKLYAFVSRGDSPAAGGPRYATTKVEGQAESLDLGVDNASTREILDALSTKFKLTYSMPPRGRHYRSILAHSRSVRSGSRWQ